MTFQHWAGVSSYTSSFDLAETCVFVKQLLGPFLCDLVLPRFPFSRSYGVILPSSLTMLLPSALGFSPHPPVSVYGTGMCITIAAFLGTWLTRFPTLVRSTLRLRIVRKICCPYSYHACTGFLFPGSCSPHASPQFWVHIVQESPPVIHRLRLSTSP